MADSESGASSVDTYRSVSIDRLSPEEKKMVIEAMKIARITAIGAKQTENSNSLVTHVLKQLIDLFEGANEVWLARTSASKSSSTKT